MSEPRIVELEEKTIVGFNTLMSLAENQQKTVELWKVFLAKRAEIKDISGSDLFSLQVYPPNYFTRFNPANPFVKWAAVEVNAAGEVPQGMEAMTIPAGQYAVFRYKGASSNAGAAFQYIYGTWIPNSNYRLDDRPHFEILGSKYKQDHPESEEDIWIPIATK